MERIITQSMQKIARIIPPLMFSLHVGKYKQEGLKTKYSLNGRLVTIDGVMNSNSSQWDLIQATADLMAIFERRAIERKEEKLEHRAAAGTSGTGEPAVPREAVGNTCCAWTQAHSVSSGSTSEEVGLQPLGRRPAGWSGSASSTNPLTLLPIPISGHVTV